MTKPELPATNSPGERQTRPAVVHRKVSAGNKTEKGAKTLASLASLAATLPGSPDEAVHFWQSSESTPS